MSARAELLARVEAASGPDREIDVLLWAELIDNRDIRYADGMVLAKSRRVPFDECRIGFIDPGKKNRNFYTAGEPSASIPRYTDSIDDALAVVEKVLPGQSWRAGNTLTRSDDLTKSGGFCRLGTGPEYYAATPPLAIIVAVLRAERVPHRQGGRGDG